MNSDDAAQLLDDSGPVPEHAARVTDDAVGVPGAGESGGARQTSDGAAPDGSVSFTLPTVEHTLSLGRAVGRRLRAGDLVILTGSLGAGKTALTKGIGAGLGVVGTVMSPTFVIARVHAGDVPLVHVDAYRLTGAVELDDLDLDTDLGRSAVVVEWGEGIAEQLTDQRLIIALERLPDDTRTATLTPVGRDWVDRLAGLTEPVEPGGG